MKKTVLLLSLLLLVVAAQAQQTDASSANPAAEPSPEGTLPTSVSFPIERVQTPTHADIYCAGFLSKQLLPNTNFVAGRFQLPNTQKCSTRQKRCFSRSSSPSKQSYSTICLSS